MNKTPIEWTDFTVNPFRFRNLETGKVGHHCAKISPGCKRCYSSTMQAGPYLSGLTFIEENKPKGEFFLDEGVLEQVLKRKKPARIFWCDMTDMFLADYPDEWIDRCFAVMALTPHLTHQVLTKRADRMREYLTNGGNEDDESMRDRMDEAATHFQACHANMNPPERWPLPNVWLGVSVEDQPRADERIPHLLQTPAAVRFLSVEPLLATLNIRGRLMGGVRPATCAACGHGHGFDRCPNYGRVAQKCHERGCQCPGFRRVAASNTGIHWVIIGGESGPGARACDLAWIRSVVEQCKATGVATFVKQLGAKPYGWINKAPGQMEQSFLDLRDKKGGDMSEWPEDMRVREMPR